MAETSESGKIIALGVKGEGLPRRKSFLVAVICILSVVFSLIQSTRHSVSAIESALQSQIVPNECQLFQREPTPGIALIAAEPLHDDMTEDRVRILRELHIVNVCPDDMVG